MLHKIMLHDVEATHTHTHKSILSKIIKYLAQSSIYTLCFLYMIFSLDCDVLQTYRSFLHTHKPLYENANGEYVL